ncbi:hypothetical protein [Streptomyces mirabilis]
MTFRRRVELAHFGRERTPEPGSPTRFERRVGDCHHNVMRRSYGVVDDVPRGQRPGCFDCFDRLFHRPQFLSTVIRPVRKDSHVREP